LDVKKVLIFQKQTQLCPKKRVETGTEAKRKISKLCQ